MANLDLDLGQTGREGGNKLVGLLLVGDLKGVQEL